MIKIKIELGKCRALPSVSVFDSRPPRFDWFDSSCPSETLCLICLSWFRIGISACPHGPYQPNTFSRFAPYYRQLISSTIGPRYQRLFDLAPSWPLGQFSTKFQRCLPAASSWNRTETAAKFFPRPFSAASCQNSTLRRFAGKSLIFWRDFDQIRDSIFQASCRLLMSCSLFPAVP